MSGPEIVLDPDRLASTSRRLCETFGIPFLHPFQIETGQNILQKRSTILDVPTGSGKTLAFFYALFYYWWPGNTERDSCQKKIIVIISPLVALMQAQVVDLLSKQIPAVAIYSEVPERARLLKELSSGKYRVCLVGPETALSPAFGEVTADAKFRQRVICLVIDEVHAISEWGTDDFRPEFASIGSLRPRFPPGTPILAASATLPTDVILDIQEKLGLPADCARVMLSNAKPNVALSVRRMKHPEDTMADLLCLLPPTAARPSDIPVTLIYVNGRTDAEDIQDFFQD